MGLLALFSLSGCGGGDGPSGPPTPVSLTVAPAAVSLQGIGQSQTAQATALDRRGSPIAGAAVTWTSGNPAVATVTGSGSNATITSVGPGATVVTAQTTTGSGSGAVAVTVTAELRSVSTSATSVSLDFGTNRTRVLTASANADPGVNATYTWSSSDPTVVTVSPSTGATTTLTAVGAGTARVTLSGVSPFGGSARTADVTVTVVGTVRSVSVTPSAASLTVGQTVAMRASVDADPGVSTGVTWSSSNPAVATVNTTGVVTAVTPGSATIVAISQANAQYSGQATVQVQSAGRSVTLNQRTVSLAPGGQVTLSATVSGEAGFPTTVTWLTRNTGVATVNAGGTVTGVAAGTTTIVATATGDATVKDSAAVTVAVPTSAQAVTTFTSVKAPAMPGLPPRHFDNLYDIEYTPAGQLVVAADCAIHGRNGTSFTASTLPNGDCPGWLQRSGSGLLVVAWSGSIYRWTAGLSFTVQSSVPFPDMGVAEVWVAPTGEAYAVGWSYTKGEGAAYRLSGGTWTALPLPTNPAWFTAVHGTSATDVVVAGNGGLLYRFNGTVWTSIPGLGIAQTEDIWSPGDGNWFLATGGGGAWRLNGTTLFKLNGDWTFRVNGTSSTDVIFNTCGFNRWDGATFQHLATVGLGNWCYYPDYFALNGTEIAHIAGGGIVRAHGRTASGTTETSLLAINPQFSDVAVTSTTHALAVGSWGQVARWTGTAWRSELLPNYDWAAGVASLGPSQSWAVGAAIYFSSGSTWQTVFSSPNPLYGVWANNATDVWAVGYNGLVLRFNGTAWTTLNAGTTAHLWAVWGTGPTNMFIGGDNGLVLRYNGSTFQQLPTGVTSPIGSIHGTGPNDVYAGPRYQTGLLRFNGTAWSLMPDTDNMSAYGLWVNSPNDIYASYWCVWRMGVSTPPQSLDCNNTIYALEGVPLGGAVGAGYAGRLWLGRNATSGFGRVGTTPVSMAAARLAREMTARKGWPGRVAPSSGPDSLGVRRIRQ